MGKWNFNDTNVKFEKVLITSFQPFNNSNNNYSYEVMKKLHPISEKIKYTTIVLDVLYDESYNYLNRNYSLDTYDLIVSLGEARSRKELTIECYAKNISSCSIPDNNGVLKQNEVIIQGGDINLKTRIPIFKVISFVKTSQDAGKYVCNNLYYHLLYNYSEKSLFIHIPNCYDNDEQYNKYAQAIDEIIFKILT